VTRADLLALTTDALTRLANVGLVKRALKDAEAGAVTDLTVDADGTVVAVSKDGATTRLPPRATLAAAPCTCGAATVCRHRLTAVLAYQRQFGSTAAAATAWDPGAFNDAEVAATCGAGVAIADRLAAAGLTITVEAGAAPVARLPMATVQFLVPGSLPFAKCDCSKGAACEHVVLAVRGFRQRPDGGLAVFGGGAATEGAARAGVTARDAVEQWAAQICQFGVTAPGAAERTEALRALAVRERWAWIADACEAYEREVDRLAAAKASFRAATLTALVGELLVRARAAAADVPELRPAWVLGSDAPADVAMEKVRLVALGCRLVADDDRRLASLYFVDPDTATVLVLAKAWSGERRNGPELGRLFASSRMSITELVQGELVTRAARRKANGALDLGASRSMQSTLLPAGGGWDALPEPILVRDLRAHARRLAAGPPAVVAPRLIGHGVAVVAIARVARVAVSADGLELIAVVHDAADNPLTLCCDFEAVCPGAVDALAAALAATPRFVAGVLEARAAGWRMRPLAVVTTRLVVLDVAPPRAAAPDAPAADGPHDAPGDPGDDPLRPVRRAWHDFLDATLLQGLRAAAPLAVRAGTAATALAMSRLAPLLGRAGTGDVAATLDLFALAALAPHADLERLAGANGDPAQLTP